MTADESLLDRLSDRQSWEDFYTYKTSLACPKSAAKELRAFIDAESYLPVCRAIASGERFPLPKKAVISKMGSKKKRIVYTYPYAENQVMKLLTHLILREYDGIFSGNLYSFRPGRSAKDAVRKLVRTKGIWQMYSYKADISNYFNSIPLSELYPMIDETVSGDPRLSAFLMSVLKEPYVLDGGIEVKEEKDIMAGTPLSSFFANLYLRDLDRHFASLHIPYMRYSDDIIVFARDTEALEEHIRFIRGFLSERGLIMNPDKEERHAPGEQWSFLGFGFCRGTVDISPATVKKLKQKMRRKTRALARWAKRNDAEPERAAAAFIRIFNRKLIEDPTDNDLSWSCWFFSCINTSETLHEIDLYAQDCLRYLLSGTRTKSRYSVRYEDLKALGYRNLVHEYYSYTADQTDT